MEDRTIVFEGINNCRDLGGLKNSEGKTIRRGCLIRSAHLGEASDNDIKKLREMHLQTVVDLRTIVETREKPDRYPEEEWDRYEQSVLQKLADEVKISIRGDEVKMTVSKSF